MSSANPNDILSAYHDREATPNEESAAKALVEGSPEAGREVKDYQRLSRLIQELPRLAAPSEFAAAVMQRAERESLIPLDPVTPQPSAAVSKKSLAPRQRWLLAAVATVSVAAVLLIAVNVFGPFKTRAPREKIARQERGSPLADSENRKVSTLSLRPSALERKEATVQRESAAPSARTAVKDDSSRPASADSKADTFRRTPEATPAAPTAPALVTSPVLRGASAAG